MPFFQSLGVGLAARWVSDRVCEAIGKSPEETRAIGTAVQISAGTMTGILTADPHGAATNAAQAGATQLVHHTVQFAALEAANQAAIHGGVQAAGQVAASTGTHALSAHFGSSPGVEYYSNSGLVAGEGFDANGNPVDALGYPR